MKKFTSFLIKYLNLTPFIAITFFFFVITIMTSCKGRHIIVDYDVHTEEDTIDTNKAIRFYNDSIEAPKKLLSQSITLKEHRVYYVDYSWSMISGSNSNANGSGRSLLKLVQESLKKSIRKIDGENITIEIIPFLDTALWKETGKPNKIFKIVKNKSFNDGELVKMDEFIDSIEPIKKPDGTPYNTHHSIVISDFLNNRIIDSNQYHMMILLTDGVDESNKDKLSTGVSILDKNWSERTNGKYVFGIFSNVLMEDIPGELPKRFKEGNEQGLFYQQGLDFAFNPFIIKDISPIDIRKDSIALVPFGGTPVEFLDRVQEDEYYRYTLEQPTDTSSYLKIFLETKKLPRPNEHTYYFKCNYKKKEKTNIFPPHHEIKLTIKDEKSPNIKFWTASQFKDSISCVVQELEYCKKLNGTFDQEWSDTLTLKLKYEKSNDAKYRNELNKIKLSVDNLPVYVKLLSKKEFFLDKPSDSICVTFTLDPSNDELKDNIDFESYISITGADSLKAIYVNNMPLDKVNKLNKIGIFRLRTEECYHPIIIALICLFIGLLTALFITLLIFWIRRKLAPRFPEDVSIRFHLRNIKGKNPNITMAPCFPYKIGLVNVEKGTNVHGSNILFTCRFTDEFINKIIISTEQQDVDSPIKKYKRFSRKWFSQKWKGDTIYVQGFYGYPIDEIVIALKGNKSRTYAKITISEGAHKRNEILRLYKLSGQGEVAIAVNDYVQLVAYRNGKTSMGN